MKPYIFLITFLLLLATACGQATVSTPTRTPKPTHSATPTITLTPQPSSTPSAPPTPTAFPTLPVEPARARFFDLLATNGNCRLPCLWGITPGKTTPQETRAILEPLHSISGLQVVFRLDSVWTMPELADGLAAHISVDFLYPNYQSIRSMFFQTGVRKTLSDGGLDPASFAKLTDYYRLDRILSEYGVPTEVVISTSGIPVAGFGKSVSRFLFVVIYPKYGFYIEYMMSQRFVGKNVLGCPKNAELRLETFPLGGEFRAMSDGIYVWPRTPNDIFRRPLSKATSMSLEQFYETFRKPTDKCIETPENLWYKPKR